MSRSRIAAIWQVYIDGVVDQTARVLSVEESLGGKSLDNAVVEIDPSALQQRGIALKTKPNMASEIVISSHFEGKNFTRHWGKISQIEPHVDPTGLRWRITSRMEPFHFSTPLDGVIMKEPVSKQYVKTNRNLVFNPTIDGANEPNCSYAEPTLQDANYFIDPESVRTPSALKLHGNKAPVFWTLAKAVYYLCKWLNRDEFYVKNPTYEELKAVFNDDHGEENDTDVHKLRNVTMPFGAYLSQCLDRLLVPLGYLWHIDKNSGLNNKFGFVRKGTGGRALRVKHQAPGSSFDNKSSEASNISLRYGLTNLANHVWLFGSAERVEFTCECVRTWSADKDSLTAEQLHIGSEDFEANENVYRKWVIDTAGDYTETRQENKDQRFKLDDLFGYPDQVPGRRKLGPTLTLGADGGPVGNIQGVYVEYSNPNYVADGEEPEWLPIGNWGCALMEKEAGVYFRGDEVPEEILNQGTNAKIRITATLESDLRVFTDTQKLGTSVNGDDVWLALDMADRFLFLRQIGFGTYKSRFYDDVLGKVREANTGSDKNIMEEFGETLRNTYDAAEISGPIVLHGCDYDFKLGDRIIAIDGLKLELLCNPASYPLQYPQVAAITYEPQTQTTTLQLERFQTDVTPPEVRQQARRRKR